MLVVTRREGEGLWIGDQIEVRVLAIGQGKVRIGVGAPDDVQIVREELIEERDRDAPAGGAEQIA
jgi:carbon storage regulator